MIYQGPLFTHNDAMPVGITFKKLCIVSREMYKDLSAFGSVLGLEWLFTSNMTSKISLFGEREWRYVLAGITWILFLLFVVSKYRFHFMKIAVFGVEDKEGIEKWLVKFCKEGGRTAIMTRDMSWANGEDAQSALLEKSTRGELNIYAPTKTTLLTKFTDAGAHLTEYGSSFIPESRFTIIDFGTSSARLAVGRRSGDLHIIEVFSAADHPVFSVAKDLLARLESK